MSSLNATTSSGIVATADNTATLQLQTAGTNALNIDASQNVGIGTTSPAVELEVVGQVYGKYDGAYNGTGLGNFAFRCASNTNYQLWGGYDYTNNFGFIQATNVGVAHTNLSLNPNGGNVGIGTTSPSSAIEVARGTGGTAYLSLRGNNNSIANELVVGQGSDGSAFVYQRANSAIQFGTNNTTRMIIDANGNLLFNSGYGSAATAYGCRAWVNFNGTGTVAIRASGNVSSITDNGIGQYTLNFTTAMPDANYSWSGLAGSPGVTNGFQIIGTPLAASVSIVTLNTAIALFDPTYVTVMVMR